VAAIKAIFWDIGGVLLTNAWDGKQRLETLSQFHLDAEEFHDRHEMLVSSFECGKIGLEEYLDHTIFYRPRPFTKDAFKQFMFSLSQPDAATLEIARDLARSGRYLMATINNESRDLNQYRIERFGLREIFSLFVSSCYVGIRKPEEGIYRLALEVTQRTPSECCFVDDRALNVDAARRLGMQAIEKRDAAQLKQKFLELGVSA
jgi:putative hydrolase of the HAD superfamily